MDYSRDRFYKVLFLFLPLNFSPEVGCESINQIIRTNQMAYFIAKLPQKKGSYVNVADSYTSRFTRDQIKVVGSFS